MTGHVRIEGAESIGRVEGMDRGGGQCTPGIFVDVDIVCGAMEVCGLLGSVRY